MKRSIAGAEFLKATLVAPSQKQSDWQKGDASLKKKVALGKASFITL